ncbi:hypothetical protein GGH96_000333 [Coemansia sp. RSA 1972]|nr:hypothetical protein GGH96_000333 [Coemansia sp. RSA 1972]
MEAFWKKIPPNTTVPEFTHNFYQATGYHINKLECRYIPIEVTAMLCACTNGQGLLSEAATVTDIKSFEKAMSSNWASVYYQVNQNLESLHFLGKPGEYEDATSLYGTDRIPASYIPTWPAGFQSRAEELAKQSPGSSASESTDESSKSESDNETESDSDDVESESSDAPRGVIALGRVASAVVAAAVLSCM